VNWINLNVTVLDSEEFLGADPTERATWLCLLRYCVGQENAGRIEGARRWKDRKWQQVVRVTGKEVAAECDLWSWDGDDLIVEFYPLDKEVEVQTNRANGSKGGRPRKAKPEPIAKPIQNHPVSETETTRFEIAETERKGKGKEREGEGEGNTPLPPSPTETEKPLVSLQAAIAHAPMVRMTPKAAEHWWHTRNAAGWTRSSASGGHPRKITSWQSDMATSREWAEEAAAKAPAGSKPPTARCL
jgi:hypothetical protein